MPRLISLSITLAATRVSHGMYWRSFALSLVIVSRGRAILLDATSAFDRRRIPEARRLCLALASLQNGRLRIGWRRLMGINDVGRCT